MVIGKGLREKRITIFRAITRFVFPLKGFGGEMVFFLHLHSFRRCKLASQHDAF